MTALWPGLLWMPAEAVAAHVDLAEAPTTKVARAAIDLDGDRLAMVSAIAAAVDVPHWFRPNWDALNDALNDLSWLGAGPLVLVLTIAGTGDDDADILVEVLARATRRWSTTARPLTVILAR